MRQPDIDGALVGGASLDPRSFAQNRAGGGDAIAEAVSPLTEDPQAAALTADREAAG